MQVAYFADYSHHVSVAAAPEVRITCYQRHRSGCPDPTYCVLLTG